MVEVVFNLTRLWSTVQLVRDKSVMLKFEFSKYAPPNRPAFVEFVALSSKVVKYLTYSPSTVAPLPFITRSYLPPKEGR